MSRDRLNGACIVRWIAALLVMTGHMYVLLGMDSPPVVLWNVSQRVGIIFFFLLGGYVISGSWEREPHIGAYVVKRVVRIFPPLILFVLFTALIAGPILSSLSVKEYFQNPLLGSYLKNIALYVNYSLPGVFAGNPYAYVVNGSLWSLPVEVLMYAVVPLFYKISRKNVKLSIGIVGIICFLCIIKRMLYPEFSYVIYGMDLAMIIEVVPFYFIGMLVYALEKTKFKIDFKPEMAIIIGALSIFLCTENELVILILSFIGLPFVVFGIAHCPSSGLTKLLSKCEITYGIYLYGFFIQQCVIFINYKYSLNLSFFRQHIIAILITVVVSMISYKFVEKPLMKWSKCLIKSN